MTLRILFLIEDDERLAHLTAEYLQKSISRFPSKSAATLQRTESSTRTPT